MPNNTLKDGDFTTASAVTDPHFTAPFDGDNGRYVLEEEYVIDNDYFLGQILALNTAHLTYPTYFLTNESEPQPTIAPGIVRWKRTYCAVPATRNDEGSLAYNFIGYWGKTAGLVGDAITFPIIGRGRVSETVKCRIQNDYFLCGTGGSYTTPANIPLILEQRYYFPLGSISGSTFTPAYTPGSLNDILYGSATDNLWDAAAWGYIIPTYPTRANYQAAIVAGTEIVAEPSVLTRWKGNIYQRVTKYILPQ